jgi:hypothetical protein
VDARPDGGAGGALTPSRARLAHREQGRDAPIAKLLHVKLAAPDHLDWPDLDVDLAVESIEHPERFPLVSKVRSTAGVRFEWDPPNDP